MVMARILEMMSGFCSIAPASFRDVVKHLLAKFSGLCPNLCYCYYIISGNRVHSLPYYILYGWALTRQGFSNRGGKTHVPQARDQGISSSSLARAYNNGVAVVDLAMRVVGVGSLAIDSSLQRHY